MLIADEAAEIAVNIQYPKGISSRDVEKHVRHASIWHAYQKYLLAAETAVISDACLLPSQIDLLTAKKEYVVRRYFSPWTPQEVRLIEQGNEDDLWHHMEANPEKNFWIVSNDKRQNYSLKKVFSDQGRQIWLVDADQKDLNVRGILESFSKTKGSVIICTKKLDVGVSVVMQNLDCEVWCFINQVATSQSITQATRRVRNASSINICYKNYLDEPVINIPAHWVGLKDASKRVVQDSINSYADEVALTKVVDNIEVIMRYNNHKIVHGKGGKSEVIKEKIAAEEAKEDEEREAACKELDLETALYKHVLPKSENGATIQRQELIDDYQYEVTIPAEKKTTKIGDIELTEHTPKMGGSVEEALAIAATKSAVCGKPIVNKSFQMLAEVHTEVEYLEDYGKKLGRDVVAFERRIQTQTESVSNVREAVNRARALLAVALVCKSEGNIFTKEEVDFGYELFEQLQEELEKAIGCNETSRVICSSLRKEENKRRDFLITLRTGLRWAHLHHFVQSVHVGKGKNSTTCPEFSNIKHLQSIVISWWKPGHERKEDADILLPE